ncbi:MAG: hypothetical protein Q7S58_03995 [Candidatus Binatus sp.]|uniref:hypothetical protein n=1 Tax=Candidatus Binatus sp. TaxID=2811406 RepID=UPI002727CDE2|nr:hypothetical protein [Candidatus Binatus sp.]MDO8431553.1 hypothetical protein [Candidatus Binatus sp.]
MACHSCATGEGFKASYCEDCERWTFHLRSRHVLIAIGIVGAAIVAVGLAIVQPELIGPLAAVGGAGLAKRALALIA